MGAVDTPERKSGKKKGGIKRRAKRRVGVRIDMTPMVDVAFLLLIFFMVTTVFRTPKALEINLPPKEVLQDVPESKTFTIRLLADGRMYWRAGAKTNPWNRSTPAELHSVLAPIAGQNEKIIIVKVDREAEFENMVNALDELHAAKLTRFSITPLEDKEKAEVEELMSPGQSEERISLYEFMPYGAPELMEVAKRYMFRATIAGIGSIVGVFVILFVINLIIAQQQRAIPVVQMQVSDLAAPPPLSQDAPPPQVQVTPAAAPPAAAIPVPVPDAQAPEEQTIMSQEELQTSTPGMAETGEGQQIVVAPSEDELPKFGDYVYVEELPEAVTRIPPSYPDLAREAGVDGTVMVQALVGKDGKVKDVRVVKSIPMLDDAAKAAVRQWVFKPALSNNKPVAVWVGVPVKFSLH